MNLNWHSKAWWSWTICMKMYSYQYGVKHANIMLDSTKRSGIIFLFKVDNSSFVPQPISLHNNWNSVINFFAHLKIWGCDWILSIFLLCSFCTSFVRRALRMLLWLLLMKYLVHLTQHLLNHCYNFSINV